MDVAFRDVQGVDPHLEDSLLLAALRVVVIEHLGCGEVLLGGCEAGAVVEDLSAEDQVQFLVSSSDVLGSHERRDSEFRGVTDHLLGSLLSLALKAALVALLLVELVQEVNVGGSVLQVIREVVDLLPVVGVGQMVIEPSEEKLVRGQFEEVGQFLFLLLEPDEEGAVLQVDQVEQLDLDDLPS